MGRAKSRWKHRPQLHASGLSGREASPSNLPVVKGPSEGPGHSPVAYASAQDNETSGFRAFESSDMDDLCISRIFFSASFRRNNPLPRPNIARWGNGPLRNDEFHGVSYWVGAHKQCHYGVKPQKCVVQGEGQARRAPNTAWQSWRVGITNTKPQPSRAKDAGRAINYGSVKVHCIACN